jgi:polysaccharide export outer membrane protein
MCLALAGCVSTAPRNEVVPAPVPKELNKVSLPTYVIEPPDILLVDAVRVIPKSPYKIAPLDALVIQVDKVLPTAPIAGIYTVDPDGTINLGIDYKSVKVTGMSLDDAKNALETHLKGLGYKDAKAVVSLGQSGIFEQIRGEHLVRPDGTVGLGTYGNVYVSGRTITEAKRAIDAHLASYLEQPDVGVDVYAYNSKFYYVVTDGGGFGEQVARFPITGNETVLDAVSQVYGLPAVASKKIWVARPSPGDVCSDQVMPVDWCAITRMGSTATNYQVLPGDRIYVKADTLLTLDATLTKVLNPIERLFGVTLLGNSVVRSFGPRNNGTGGGGGGGGLGGF